MMTAERDEAEVAKLGQHSVNANVKSLKPRQLKHDSQPSNLALN